MSIRYRTYLSKNLIKFPPLLGVILVYDLTNSKSHDNLKTWLANAVSQRERAVFDAETFADLQVSLTKQALNLGTISPVKKGGGRGVPVSLPENTNLLQR